MEKKKIRENIGDAAIVDSSAIWIVTV